MRLGFHRFRVASGVAWSEYILKGGGGGGGVCSQAVQAGSEKWTPSVCSSS